VSFVLTLLHSMHPFPALAIRVRRGPEPAWPGPWLCLCLFMVVTGSVLAAVPAQNGHDRATGLSMTGNGSAAEFSSERVLLASGDLFRHPEGALPCHHLRTSGCSLECPHDSTLPGSVPTFSPDMNFQDPSPVIASLREVLASRRHSPAPPVPPLALPDPPPRGSSVRMSDHSKTDVTTFFRRTP